MVANRYVEGNTNGRNSVQALRFLNPSGLHLSVCGLFGHNHFQQELGHWPSFTKWNRQSHSPSVKPSTDDLLLVWLNNQLARLSWTFYTTAKA